MVAAFEGAIPQAPAPGDPDVLDRVGETLAALSTATETTEVAS